MYYIMDSVTDIVKGVVSEVESGIAKLGGGSKKRHVHTRRCKHHKKSHKKRHVHTRRCKHHKKSHRKHRKGGSLISRALVPFGLLKLQKMMQTRKARKSHKGGKKSRKGSRKARRTRRR